MSELGEQLVDAVTKLGGEHPGFRALHAKGTSATGSFVGAPTAAALTRAAPFAGRPVAATVRFSNGNGDPDRADTEPDGRGMAVRLRADDGTDLDLVALSLPVFFVRTVADFLAFTEARRPDPTTGELDLERVGAFLADHPESMAAVGASLAARPPNGFTTQAYHGIHAFSWTDADGRSRFARYHWAPGDGESFLTDEEMASAAPDYLARHLAARLEQGPASFELSAQLAGDDDDPTDPTVPWPDDREVVVLGTLTLDRFTDQGSDAMIFDPTRLVDGIDLSDDAILRARAEAYSTSYARRQPPKPA
jgi:catalase